MVDIDTLIEQKEKEIDKIKKQMKELQLIQEHEDMYISGYTAFMQLVITTEELTDEVRDVLDFSIVEESSIKNYGDEIRITADIEADFNVYDIEKAMEE